MRMAAHLPPAVSDAASESWAPVLLLIVIRYDRDRRDERDYRRRSRSRSRDRYRRDDRWG